MIMIYYGVRDYRIGYHNNTTWVILVAGFIVAAVTAFLAIKFFGVVLQDWGYAESMTRPSFTDVANFVGVGIAVVGMVVGVYYGFHAIKLCLNKKGALQQVQ